MPRKNRGSVPDRHSIPSVRRDPARGHKPLQLFTQGEQLRSIHAASYTRLYNADLLDVVQEFATDFQPPAKGFNGATGLYGGEQDMFCFLIDPAGWTEIGGEAFAPGFFLWNSEVGWRSVGHRDVLVSGGVCEPYRLGCGGSHRVLPQAHRQCP